MNIVLHALQFAIKKHKGQVRRVSGAPYVIHPILVSYLVAKYKTSRCLEELIAAAILHDTLEDTNTTFQELARYFPPLVVTLVQELTSDETQIATLGKNEYMKKKLLGLSNYALTVKLIDRLANVMDHPTSEYKVDTIDLMNHVSRRRRLTRTQHRITLDIFSTCTGQESKPGT
jgi:(p)ppGpp synthase/HD superfamily hydrolase